MALILPMACSSSDSGEEGGNGFQPFLKIDRDAKTVTVVSESWDCNEDGTGVKTLDTSLTRYAISGGKLMLWEDGECEATVFSGSSTDIVGKWVNTDGMQSVLAPDASEDCELDTVDYGGLSPFQNWKWTMEITEKGANVSYTGDYCPARLVATMFLGATSDAGESETFDLTTLQCGLVEGKRKSDQKPVKVTSTGSGNSSKVTVTFDGETCQGNFPSPDLNDANPCDDSDFDESLTSFYQCVYGSGLFPDFGFEGESLKKSMVRPVTVTPAFPSLRMLKVFPSKPSR